MKKGKMKWLVLTLVFGLVNQWMRAQPDVFP